MLKLTYVSHSTFILEDGQNTLIIDPFFTGNPTATISIDSVKPNFIVLTHAHGDHLGDALSLAKKHDALIIAVNELANYCAANGCKAHNMHIGGAYNFPFGRLKFTIAHHGSSTNDGQYMGEPAGVLINMGGNLVYHTGDTGLFYDMKLIGELNPIDILLAPIGDNFTMGIDDAVQATKFVDPKLVIPMHYNTFPVIEADPNEFKSKVEKIGKKCVVMQYGETIVFDE
ncbi:MAG TPA: metal-dependent hydrolase [Candidatus Kapabacteria bacterium]|jgi:L-ascorbate metabolism protein UlaG (beta-lactamase superfamily)|nr:metal-dependent hydrolase [Candidatus Kapabacteria bacterium]HOM04047.1 metal-dependent hydrolase [Candidatus Kapabacteria bacterium]HOQ49173.1 metal-dependent hydrolase [Candidatus Kapabacteria bacterium]HPP39778.1 metal-dependent hydrolase [Candidatus Kapabacteria bacterium]HPU23201.1 metal-dependent hydrolase [Candidatus Kapabacteria bacterium]